MTVTFHGSITSTSLLYNNVLEYKRCRSFKFIYTRGDPILKKAVSCDGCHACLISVEPLMKNFVIKMNIFWNFPILISFTCIIFSVSISYYNCSSDDRSGLIFDNFNISLEWFTILLSDIWSHYISDQAHNLILI